jgi:hypothetical protein
MTMSVTVKHGAAELVCERFGEPSGPFAARNWKEVEEGEVEKGRLEDLALHR